MDVKYGGVGLRQARVELIDPDMLVFFAKDILPLAFTWLISVVFPKLAVLTLYLKLFAIQRETRIVCYVTAGMIVANCVGSSIAGFFICQPLNFLWNQSIPGHCFQINQWYRWVRLVNIISDVVILALPIPHVLQLHTSIRMKVGLLITFLLGSV